MTLRRLRWCALGFRRGAEQLGTDRRDSRATQPGHSVLCSQWPTLQRDSGECSTSKVGAASRGSPQRLDSARDTPASPTPITESVLTRRGCPGAPRRSSRARLGKGTDLGWRHTSLNPIPSQPAHPKCSATAPPRGQRSADASPQRAPVAVKSRQPFDARGTPAPEIPGAARPWAPPRPRKMRNRASPHRPTGPSCARATTSS